MSIPLLYPPASLDFTHAMEIYRLRHYRQILPPFLSKNNTLPDGKYASNTNTPGADRTGEQTESAGMFFPNVAIYFSRFL
ncbi:MAG: hypothetical protein P4L44_07675 [Oryzomonas sp.]|uniref:hypothetical protein n=1 Tax=Oryzomonas sp. TaxID=2855186 RepID=UPI00283BF06E|nr:hypothetical protein [Oryzomonas sp.]MDR3579823.1 hypothetical protein [Oryzomonas sp.]